MRYVRARARACARNKVWFMHSSEYGKSRLHARDGAAYFIKYARGLARRDRNASHRRLFYRVVSKPGSFPYLFPHSLGLLFISEWCKSASPLRLIVLSVASFPFNRHAGPRVPSSPLFPSRSLSLRLFTFHVSIMAIAMLDHPLVAAINPLACNLLFVLFLLFSGLIAPVRRLACTPLAALLWPVYFLISFTYYRSYFARLLCVYYAPWLRRRR